MASSPFPVQCPFFCSRVRQEGQRERGEVSHGGALSSLRGSFLVELVMAVTMSTAAIVLATAEGCRRREVLSWLWQTVDVAGSTRRSSRLSLSLFLECRRHCSGLLGHAQH